MEDPALKRERCAQAIAPPQLLMDERPEEDSPLQPPELQAEVAGPSGRGGPGGTAGQIWRGGCATEARPAAAAGLRWPFRFAGYLEPRLGTPVQAAFWQRPEPDQATPGAPVQATLFQRPDRATPAVPVRAAFWQRPDQATPAAATAASQQTPALPGRVQREATPFYTPDASLSWAFPGAAAALATPPEAPPIAQSALQHSQSSPRDDPEDSAGSRLASLGAVPADQPVPERSPEKHNLPAAATALLGATCGQEQILERGPEPQIHAVVRSPPIVLSWAPLPQLHGRQHVELAPLGSPARPSPAQRCQAPPWQGRAGMLEEVPGRGCSLSVCGPRLATPAPRSGRAARRESTGSCGGAAPAATPGVVGSRGSHVIARPSRGSPCSAACAAWPGAAARPSAAATGAAGGSPATPGGSASAAGCVGEPAGGEEGAAGAQVPAQAVLSAPEQAIMGAPDQALAMTRGPPLQTPAEGSPAPGGSSAPLEEIHSDAEQGQPTCAVEPAVISTLQLGENGSPETVTGMHTPGREPLQQPLQVMAAPDVAPQPQLLSRAAAAERWPECMPEEQHPAAAPPVAAQPAAELSVEDDSVQVLGERMLPGPPQNPAEARGGSGCAATIDQRPLGRLEQQEEAGGRKGSAEENAEEAEAWRQAEALAQQDAHGLMLQRALAAWLQFVECRRQRW